MTEYRWNMFMAHIQHEDIDYIEEKLNEYSIRQYIIGMEISQHKVEHLHFMVEMEDGEYHKFSNAIFKKKYKLRGRAQKGLARQYGKVKDIEDIEKAKAYTCKDQNIRTNMSDQDIKKLIEISYEKQDKKKFIEELYGYLDEHIEPCHFTELGSKYDHMETYDTLKLLIIKYYIKNDLNLSPQYKSLIINYVRKTLKLSMTLKLNFLKHIIS